MADLAIITPSYRGDFELAVDLCRSLDRHLKGVFEHVLIVPRRDVSRFKTLEGPTRRILTQEDVVKSAGLYRLPLPLRLHIPPVLNLRIGEQWVGRGGRRVIGWIVQQIIKLSAPQISSADVFVFADSDVVLFRDISIDNFMIGGAVALHEHPRGLDYASHQTWLKNARELLGLTEDIKRAPMNYIGMLIAWRRENVLLLQQALARREGRRWQEEIIRVGNVSEYILYGMFCREVLGSSSNHTFQDINNSLSVWWTPTGDLEHEALGQLADSHVCLHLQSNLGVNIDIRHQILDRVYEAARRGEPAVAERQGA